MAETFPAAVVSVVLAIAASCEVVGFELLLVDRDAETMQQAPFQLT